MLFHIKIVVLVTLFLVQVVNLQSSEKAVLIKWVSPETMTEIRLPQKLKKNNGFTCTWFKLIEKIPIEEDSNQYVYGKSATACDLIIAQYESERQIDFYQPNIVYTDRASAMANIGAHDNDPIFALAYLKSFDVVKVKKSKNIYEYTCQVVFSLPNTDDEALNGAIKSSIDKNLVLEGMETNSPATLKSGGEGKRARFFKLIKTIKSYVTGREKRQKSGKSGMVNLFMISLNPIEIIKGANSRSSFVCKMDLIDEEKQTSVYSKTLVDDPELNNDAAGRSGGIAQILIASVVLINSLFIV